jgi:uncharacterized protein with HEPN domain
MSRHDPRAFLHDIMVACARIREFTSGIDLEVYRQNVMVRSAVERQFEIIGEALNGLSQADPELARRITDVSRIIAFRNRLIHGYATVSDEVVWGVIGVSLPLLEEEVAGLLQELEEMGEPQAQSNDGAEH